MRALGEAFADIDPPHNAAAADLADAAELQLSF